MRSRRDVLRADGNNSFVRCRLNIPRCAAPIWRYNSILFCRCRRSSSSLASSPSSSLLRARNRFSTAMMAPIAPRPSVYPALFFSRRNCPREYGPTRARGVIVAGIARGEPFRQRKNNIRFRSIAHIQRGSRGARWAPRDRRYDLTSLGPSAARRRISSAPRALLGCLAIRSDLFYAHAETDHLCPRARIASEVYTCRAIRRENSEVVCAILAKVSE